MVTRDFEKKVFNELNYIKKQLGEIKERMVDVDSILTEDEKELVDQSFENEARGKLLNFKDLDSILTEDKGTSGVSDHCFDNGAGDKPENLKDSFSRF